MKSLYIIYFIIIIIIATIVAKHRKTIIQTVNSSFLLKVALVKWRCGHTFTSIWAANTSSTSLNVPHARAPVTSQQSGSAAVNGSEARARRDHSPLLVINVNNVISRVTHVPGDDDGRRSSRGAEREPRFRCTAVIEIRGSFDATEQKGDEHTAQRIAPLRLPPPPLPSLRFVDKCLSAARRELGPWWDSFRSDLPPIVNPSGGKEWSQTTVN